MMVSWVKFWGSDGELGKVFFFGGRGEFSRWKDQQVQRPRGRLYFEEELDNHYGWME